MINTCAIWTTNYVNSWLSINILVIIASMMAIAVAYSLSSFFPSSTRGKIRGFVRFEMIQMIISIVIIGALLAFSAAACSASAHLSNSLVHTSMDPFTYADYYIGANVMNNGINLLSNIYATSISYSIYAAAWRLSATLLVRLPLTYSPALANKFPFLTWLLSRSVGQPSFPGLSTLLGTFCKGGSNFCEYERIPSIDFAQLYDVYSGLYLSFYAPIIIVALGMLFIQFLALPIMQYTAFTIILPVAIAMRSIAFFSSGLADAANGLIAIAIAFYLIYPMTVAFDSYAIGYVFSASNPASQYVNLAFTVNQVTPYTFLQGQPSNSPQGTVFSLFSYTIGSFSGHASGGNFYTPIFGLMNSVHYYTDNMAEFVYEAILMFALNISITVGLAMSIYKALKSGLGEAGRFW